MKKLFEILFVVVVIIFILLALTSLVRAHTEGTMEYDFECCHSRDCAPVEQIIPHDDGTQTFISRIGTVQVKPNDNEVKRLPSKDDKFHICMRMIGGKMKPICIYSPALF